MSFGDRLRAWLKGESKRTAPSPSSDKASRTSTRELEEFIRSRPGVEGYLEPKTAIYSTTLLVVAADGEYLRRPVRDRKQAGSVCQDADIPLYDAAKVGYPRRMRDYDRGIKRDTVSLDQLPPWPDEEGPQTDEGEAS
jgi:hypothetical protein